MRLQFIVRTPRSIDIEAGVHNDPTSRYGTCPSPEYVHFHSLLTKPPFRIKQYTNVPSHKQPL